eukprot:TRINITY_DN6393_c0_g1_i1.p1 TRINITY_DN6393_c0_g1~~TRINITY_DN6393_c0_g1_i1.p1  ORF type:complete len:211 (+),score=32.01 TRINITY_DN6393_c0_g1_i1:375-1007(+)
MALFSSISLLKEVPSDDVLSCIVSTLKGTLNELMQDDLKNKISKVPLATLRSLKSLTQAAASKPSSVPFHISSVLLSEMTSELVVLLRNYARSKAFVDEAIYIEAINLVVLLQAFIPPAQQSQLLLISLPLLLEFLNPSQPNILHNSCLQILLKYSTTFTDFPSYVTMLPPEKALLFRQSLEQMSKQNEQKTTQNQKPTQPLKLDLSKYS